MRNIETKRLTLRLLTERDAQMILTLLNEPGFIANIGDKNVRDIDGAINYIKTGPLAQYEQYGFCLYCVCLKSNDKPIGLCGLIKREEIAYPEIGYALLHEDNGNGYGFESAEAVITRTKNEGKLTTLNAICNKDNSSSINLLKKLNFNHIGNIKLTNQSQKVELYELKLQSVDE